MVQADARAKLSQLKDEIDNDFDAFAQAAQQYSSCTTASKGGDLGQFGPGMMVKPIDEFCFESGEIGVVSDVISSPYGEHLVLVRQRK